MAERSRVSVPQEVEVGPTFRIAAVQAAPVFLDREATVEKACGLVAEAGARGAQLVAFPEAFIPTYPDWVWAVPLNERALHNRLYAELLDQAVTIPSAATDRLCRAAREAETYVVVGMSERNSEASNASLYNTLLYIDPRGEILGKHRKLVPTGAERLVWAQGDGSTLAVYETPFGRLGGLICWENYMPLARYAMYAWGAQVYVAATWDRGEPWLSTLRHIAKEGRLYVVGCCIALRKADIPERFGLGRFYAHVEDWINVGDSAIVDPDGNFLDGPAREEERILYAEVDPVQMGGHKWMLDVAGHYGRPDVFELIVHQDARSMMTTAGERPALHDAAAPAALPAPPAWEAEV
jgi:nitrilase